MRTKLLARGLVQNRDTGKGFDDGSIDRCYNNTMRSMAHLVCVFHFSSHYTKLRLLWRF